MGAFGSFKRLLVILPLLILDISVYCELPEELRREVITFIRTGYLEFPEQESGALMLGSVTINSQELSDAFTQYGVLTIQRGFPEFTDDDTIRTSETGYTFVIPQFSRIFRLQLISEDNVDTLIGTLSAMPEIIGFAEKNSNGELMQVQTVNDPEFYYQWYLKNEGRWGGSMGADMKATTAWEVYKRNSLVKVGIFDDGVKLFHEDLNSRVTGDGHTEGDPCLYGHGTHVAGLIGARTNNNLGIAGVDWNCQLESYKVWDGNNWLGDVNAASKLIQASDAGVSVTNHSYGLFYEGFTVTLQLAFVYAYKMNSVTVCSMGNTGETHRYYPAHFQDIVIPVGATDWNDRVTYYSTIGWNVRVSAPGGGGNTSCPSIAMKDIISCWWNGPVLPNYSHNWGTSMAAPLVSGLASLVRGKRMTVSQRVLDNDDIKYIICFSADDVNWYEHPGWDEHLGYGRINSRRALDWTSPPFSFNYYTTSGSGATVIRDPYSWQIFTPWGISGLNNGATYNAFRYRVQKQVNIPKYFRVWGLGNRSFGYNGYFVVQHGIGYTSADKINETTVQLQSFIYDVYDWVPPWTGKGYFPCTAGDVRFAYTLHGINRFFPYYGEDRQQVGGCPWLFVYNVPDSAWYVADNNILHRSEIPELQGQDITDVCKLNITPVLTDSGTFSIKIIETEKDYGYIDKVSFKAIDHSEGTSLGVTENNDIVIYDVSDRSSSHDAELNSQNNITRYIRYEYGGNHRVTGVASDSVTAIDFEDSGQPVGDSLALIFAVSNNPQLYTDEQVKDYAGEVSMYINDSPIPLLKKFARRENESVIIIPIADVDASVDSAIITWYRDYDLKYLFVAPVSYTGYSATEIPLISAIQTIDGDVVSKLSSVDANYANLDSMSMLTLSYSNISGPQTGMVRDYIFETTGRYDKNEGEGDNMLVVKDKHNNVPLENKLYNNYPNPFNPKTTIKFSVKTDRWVKIVVYDILGREVGALLNEFKKRGTYKLDFNGASLASGVYFYRIAAGDFVQSKKMVLVK